MKEKLLLVLLYFSAVSCHSQDSLTFKIQFNPETRYNQVQQISSRITTIYSGSKEVMQKLNDEGTQDSSSRLQELKINADIKTRKLTSDTTFPLAMEFVKTTKTDTNSAQSIHLFLYGHCSLGGMPRVDSIGSSRFSEESKKIVVQQIQSILSQESFPEKKLRVGESFSRESNLALPFNGITINLSMNETYKLTDIVKDTANFEVSVVYVAKSNLEGYTVTASGGGKGKLQYDIKNSFYHELQLDAVMEINLKLDSLDIQFKAHTNSIQTTVISKN